MDKERRQHADMTELEVKQAKVIGTIIKLVDGWVERSKNEGYGRSFEMLKHQIGEVMQYEFGQNYAPKRKTDISKWSPDSEVSGG